MPAGATVAVLGLMLALLPVHAAPVDPPPESAGLQTMFGRWFEVGVAVDPGLSDPERTLLLEHFGGVTTRNCLKPAKVQPVEGRFAFDDGDALVAFARKHRLKVHGHTLVWHVSCPDWFFVDGDRPADRARVLGLMRTHIETVMGRYRGRIASWDVVNEALADDATGYLRSNRWVQCVGEDYVAEAFLAAARADPGAELFYNDYQIERPAKRAKALRLVRELRARGARVDGIGIQGHWTVHGVPLADIEAAIAEFRAAGLKVAISELDMDVLPRSAKGQAAVADPYAAACPPEVLGRQAALYGDLFRLFRRQAASIDRVTFWTLHDGQSWLNFRKGARVTNHPLLWDRNLRPKPAFTSVVDVAREDMP